MKQVFLQKGKAVVQDVPMPNMHENIALVRVHYSFISSGTEGATLGNSGESLARKVLKNPVRSAYKLMASVAKNGVQGTKALIAGHSIGPISGIGYSCAGQVIAVGKNIKKYNVGDFVACAGAGIANHADVVAVPENLMVKVCDPTFLKQASITTIGAIAMQGIRRADLSLGESVCVIGLGLLGQLSVQMAKASGCKVFAVDLDPERVTLAKDLGADYAFVGTESDLEKEIEFATQHHGVDATIIAAACSTSGAIIDQSMRITRRKGRVILVGDVKIDFSRSPFYAKEIDFLISCSYGPGRYDPNYEHMGQDYPYSYVRWTENRNMQLFVELVEQKKIRVDPLISRTFKISEGEKAYDALKEKKDLGLALDYEVAHRDALEAPEEPEKQIDAITAQPYVAPPGDVKVGFVGVGGFARVKLLPIVKECAGVKIDAIVDAEVTGAVNIARQYKASVHARDHKEITNNKDLHAVVIATPHAYHAQQILDFASQGKAVFSEKPACVTHEQLAQLEAFFEKNENALFSVDFNRSWAPFNQEVKKAVVQRTTPLVVNYRMNAGFIPKTHWIQSDEHRGRIIGEGCHIFELFSFLTDARPVSVSVTPIKTASDDVLQNDNVSAQVQFDDGSSCTLVYVAVGNTELAKERMEVFFDGKSIVMDDYKELKGFGLPKSFDKKVMTADKGHEALISEFFKQTRSNNPRNPIPLQRIFDATRLSLLVDDLARAGGGYRKL